MAEAIPKFNHDQKLKQMTDEVVRVFDELFRHLVVRRDLLLDQLDKIRQIDRKNSDLTNAIKEIRIMKDGLKSNLLESLDKAFGEKIRVFKNARVHEENLKFLGFRCHSEKIRKAIDEIDLYQICPDYVGREEPFLTACYQGHDDRELYNPKGIALDRARNEVYVCDTSNKRIQVLSSEGEYVRQFGRNRFTEPYAICISQQDELFVTDQATQCVQKFSLTGEFLKRVGSRGNKPGDAQFSIIAGLCCEAGYVYICDAALQLIQIFDTKLNYIKYFGHGEISFPIDIRIVSDTNYTMYILSVSSNCIFCYNRDCTLRNKIELFGQEQLMTTSNFFTIDKKGNFLITDQFLGQIRIFSSKGLLSNILGRGQQLRVLAGVTLDKFDKIICVCNSKDGFLKF